MNGLSRNPSLAERTNPAVIRKLGKVRIFGSIPRLPQPSARAAARHLDAGGILKAFQGWRSQKRNQARRLARLDRKRIWHPFTQMSEWERSDPLVVESADGVHLKDTRGSRYLDGVSSLWVNLHGHAHPALDGALRRQIGKVAHSTLLGAANVPSIELAEGLVRLAPKGLTRLFYSDNGSTAVEIALKMAFQHCQQNGQPKRRRFLHFANAYHGDTIGSVSVGGIDLFHKVYGPLLFKGFKAASPYCYRCPLKLKYPSCKIACLKPFEKTLAQHRQEIAAVVVEPLVQGAAGMITQPPGWLKRVARACRRHGVFLIADEVAVGFGRTGTMFACQHEGVRPDFLCLAKGLSGGCLPLAATLTTERVYRGFLGSYASQRTFFHGHSYTGNPLACAAGLESLKVFRRERVLQKLKAKIRLFREELKRFEELPRVGDIRQRGLAAGIELVEDKKTKRPFPWQAQTGIRVCRYLRARGILLRPLGNVIVLMPPLSISAGELRRLCRETAAAIQNVVG
ncbi:MAG: adenosylmethionine--8-amino-7-oxononanoate transaminase [Candidatus Omnitrophica bacterium]|nr:adenosylmethionine--8-amino-7-oxononanoate transaminase [Candidatus Omnitrophota bacterium]